MNLHTRPTAPATLSAARLKISTTLIPSELLGVPAPNGVQRTTLHIQLPDRVLTAEISNKGLRKAQATIREAGDVVVVLQGRLVGDRIEEAGLAAQPKAQKPL